MLKTVTLDDIDTYLYNWLTTASNMATSLGGVSIQWVKANQNAPAPALPYGYWYLKELTNFGHKDMSSTYNAVDETLAIDNLSFYTFSVEVTALGYGSNGVMSIISQFFDTEQFAFDAQVAGIGYLNHGSSQDISSVADAEVREARQFTVTFSCVMKISEVLGMIKTVTGEGTIYSGANEHTEPFEINS